MHIRGEADGVQAIAQFISALVNSPRFGGVKLKQYYQDDQHGRRSFKFNLDCSYIQPGNGEPVSSAKSALAALPPEPGR